jgi:methionyl-tRNA synthetase
VTDPVALAERFGVDNLRYFLMREVVFGKDGSYSPEAIVTRANADLANSFGNLAQRTMSMIFKNMDGKLEDISRNSEDRALIDQVRRATQDELPAAFEKLDFHGGLESWMRAVFACNAYVDEMAPWALRKSDPDRMRAVLMTLFESVRALAIAVRPVIPASADRLLDQMGVEVDARDFAALADDGWMAALIASGFALDKPEGVFPRLELPQEEAA